MRRRHGSSYRRGEAHPKARASDHDVALAIELVTRCGLSSVEVGRKFDVAPRTVRDWVARSTRAIS